MNAPVNVDPREDAYAIPLDKIDVSQPRLYQDDIWHPYFERLRREDPVHWCENGMYGSYWSVTRYKDIMQVDTNQQVFSSDAMMGGIVLRDAPVDFRRPSFISMDQPKHDEQRKVVSSGRSGKSAAADEHDPRADPARAGQPAAWRDVRLG